MPEEKEMTWWENFKWKCWFYKLMFQSWLWSVDDKTARRQYCRKGYHKLRSGREGHQGPKDKRMKWVRFLKCQHCNYLFFASESHKKRWLKFQGTTKEGFSAWLKSLSSGKP